jgi:hypothetical protein
MKTEKKWYFVLVFVITLLLYDQYTGLNILLISLISVSYLYVFNDKQKTKKWWLSAVFWIGSGLSIFLSNTYLGGVLFFITGLNFISINNNSNHSFPFSIIHSFFSIFIGIARFITPKKKPIILELSDSEEMEIKLIKSKETTNKILKNIFLYGIPFLLVLVFLKLYQLANPKFAEYTEFINFEFMNWNFLLLYGLLILILYGIYLFNSFELTSKLDLKTKNIIPANYSDKLQKSLGLETEQKMTLLLLSILNLLIMSFIIIDAITLFSNNIELEISHSENVHQGVNVLITSIVLVILILGFVFRGGLNFVQNKSIKTLSSIWLILNLIITGFNSIKNFNYIHEWGLTHKRIGVYTYLALCVIGLLYTLYKIINKKSFAFLVRRVLFTFSGGLVFFSFFNWNLIIANHNLNDQKYAQNQIDFYYNLNLGFEAYPALIDYFKKHPKANIPVYEKLDYKITTHMEGLQFNWKEIPSIKWSEYLVEKELKKYIPLKNNNYQPSR